MISTMTLVYMYAPFYRKSIHHLRYWHASYRRWERRRVSVGISGGGLLGLWCPPDLEERGGAGREDEAVVAGCGEAAMAAV